jgi:adenine-specific DNA-methyltransferase
MSDLRPPLPDPLPAPLARVATPDLNAERLATLKRLLPDLFTAEGRINPDELRRLADAQGTADAERYEFKWYGKQRSKRHAFTPSLAALAYDARRSCRPEKAGGNAIIEGENLEVLKLLLPAYRGRVKCILIDPPYNTGKDFVYRDNYARDRKEYWEETGVTEQGVKVDTNTDTSGRYHSDWLSMMHSRLLLARQFLTEDGYICVCIDDAEVANLARILDEVFGEENHIATLIYDKNRKNDAKFFSVGHEYVLVYARDKAWLTENGTVLRADKEGVDEVREVFEKLRKQHKDDWGKVREDLKAHYATWPEDDARQPLARFHKVDADGPYRDDGNINWPGGGGPTYDVLHPKTGKPCKLPRSGWRYPNPVKMASMIKAGLIVFGPDENTVPSVRSNLFDKKTQVMPSVVFSYAQTASQEFAKLFGGKKVFDNPKSTDDFRKLVEYLTDEGDLVLDFFAGSGTTGHAVLGANSKRQFILVQIPELITDKDATGRAALSLGLKRISDLTIDRVRRVIEGDGSELTLTDAGFRVYRLRPSYFPRCEWAPDATKTDAENLAELEATLKAKEASLTMQFDADLLLEEVLLKQGFGFARTVERLETEFPKNTVYQVRDGEHGALVCLDAQLAPETVDALQKRKPDQRFVCLELALDTTRKWTLTQHLGDYLTAL